MLTIGKSYLTRSGSMTRLCADITIGRHKTTLWFAVETAQEDCLCVGRADPFVVALLPTAMRGKHEIICKDTFSERLHHQLSSYVIPALAFAGEIYHIISIKAPLTAAAYPNQGAVGTGFSGGVDSMYTIMCHGPDSEYPVTHLALFDTGGLLPEHSPEERARFYSMAKRFSEEHGLKTISVRTNLEETLSNAEPRAEVYSFRNLARALSVQGLFSVYLLSSGPDAASFALDLHESSFYDPLLVPCASTEGLTFYFSGTERKRLDKLKLLSEWEPTWRWLHPCLRGAPGEMNCGRCKKCIRDLTVLYALDKLERYSAVFDIKDFRKNLAARLGFILAKYTICNYDEAAGLLKESGKPIPPAAYAYAKQFDRAIENLRAQEAKKEAIRNEQ